MHADVRNKLLVSLPPDELRGILPLCEEVPVEVGERIIGADETIRYAFFPESGLLSVSFDAGGRGCLDMSVVGQEGMVSTASVLGVGRTPHEVRARVGGTALRIAVGSLRELILRNAVLRLTLMRYVQATIVSGHQTALGLHRCKLEQRLAAWVLQAADRLPGDDIEITHEVLAQVLGTHRPGITAALQKLVRGKAIAAGRRKLTVLDRARLAMIAGAGYGTAEREYARLIAPLSPGRPSSEPVASSRTADCAEEL
ncbi:Crp/Fnr family transcriptional regulator [Methylobacterium sp. WSM2598]|uniref:Crp/Fnr family transcriptional regulator n=1 Tax=Methylobacterium sp. WSM2598 TaxID=398261 RepID=UPI000368DE23|nr:Crp/Fnr family transcriptional regulator [Methylobacterium sp. WSM2598]